MPKFRCKRCKKSKPSKAFSGNQLKKSKSQRRCKKCVINEKKAKSIHNTTINNAQKMLQNMTCNELTKCPHLIRIIDTLKYYKKQQNKKTFREISQYFDMNKYEIINAYYHIMQQHLNEDTLSQSQQNKNFKIIYDIIINESNNLQCDLKKCVIFNRNNREREHDHIRNFGVDFIDSIHCYFLHSIDIGYKLPTITSIDELKNNNDDNDVSQNKNGYHDHQLFKLKSYLKTKQKTLQHIGGNKRMQNNKFSTQMISDITNEKDKVYSFGNSFNYWKNQALYDIHGLKPKYKSLKNELINNKLFNIDINVFDESYEKAVNLMNINQVKYMKCKYNDKTFGYGIKIGTPLPLNHLLSVIFYTDYSILSFKFSSTFRKIEINETDDELKKRNQEYGNWTKYLVETVNCFGTKVCESQINVFYHGVSLIYFDKFTSIFNCPTSTTTKLQIATIFAKNDGVILELKPYQIHDDFRYFDCSFISFYANEDEKLFIQPPDIDNFLKIVGIRTMETMENYSEFLLIMDIFSVLLGQQQDSDLDYAVPSNCIDTINGFMDLFLNDRKSNINNKYPIYIWKTLQKWRNGSKYVIIKRNILNKYAKAFSIKLWSDSMNNVPELNKLNKIFPNIDRICVQSIGVINAFYFQLLFKMIQSINILKYSKLNQIYLSGITKVNYASMELLKYTLWFKQIGWDLKINDHSLNLENTAKLPAWNIQ